MNSPFKSILTDIYDRCLTEFELSHSTTTKDDPYGIFQWFNYLIKYFLPTTPIWSNLLLGNAS